MSNPFVILSMARSGSTHLVSLLDRHPDVTCYGEPLATGANGGWCASDDELVTAFTGARTTAVGYKILGEQLAARPSTLPRLEQVHGIRFIVLERRNQLDRLRSFAQAELTGVWAWGTTAAPPPPPCVYLDPQMCIERLAQAERFYTQCRRLHPTAWIYYEDLRDDQDDTLESVWELLGVASPGPLQSTLTRLEDRPLRDTIINWDELGGIF